MNMLNFVIANARPVAFDNDFGTDGRAYIPEVWAQESLMVLEENMVAGNLVHRDFEDEIAEYGDVVNTRRPGSFEAKRKIDSDSVTIQDATAEKVQVKLNQHLHTTFMIKDGEMTKSFKDLVTEFLKPAVVSIANSVDQIVLGQTYQFLDNNVGKLGTAAGKSTVIAANTLMNTNKVPVGSGARNFILTPSAEGDLLDVSDFTKVNEAGDGGNALQNAMLGRKFGYDFYMDQNQPSVAATQTVQAAAVNKVGGYAAGVTTMLIDSTSDTLLAGQWFTVAGDMIPQMVTAASGTPTTSVTFAPGLKTSVLNDAVVTVYPYGAVDLTAGYAASWVKDIVTKTFAEAPLQGQMLTYGITSAADTYGLIGTPTITNIALDRETQSLMADSAQLNLGPAGQYSLGIHRNAIALVSRPLVTVPSNFGANQAVVSYNGLSMRVSMQYDGTKQGMLVTVDTLVGVKVLDTDLGVVMFS